MEKTYFEEHATELLSAANMTKAQFAKAMDVLPQNVNKLFSTKNVLVLMKAAQVLNTSLQVLVYGTEEHATHQADAVNGCIYVNGKPTIFNSRQELTELLNND